MSKPCCPFNAEQDPLSPTPDKAAILPLPQPITWPRMVVRSLIGLAVVVSFLLLLRYDTNLMAWRYNLLPEGPEGLFKQVSEGFRDFAQTVPITVALIIVATCDTRRWTIIAMVLSALLLSSIGYNTGKGTIARYRPYAAKEKIGDFSTMTSEQTWLGWRPGNHDNDYRSFPSGHSAAAFAFAVTLGWFYPRLRWLFLTLAFGCALSRYVDAVHWLSDCLAGATIGYLSGWLALRPYAWLLPLQWCRPRAKKCCE